MTLPPIKYTEMFKKKLTPLEYEEIAVQIEGAYNALGVESCVRFIDVQDSETNPNGESGWFTVMIKEF